MFYLTGFITVLLIYVWLDEFWLAAYNVPDYAAEAEKIPRLVVFHPASLVAGVVLVAAAVIYKKVLRRGPGGVSVVLLLSGRHRAGPGDGILGEPPVHSSTGGHSALLSS